jgi:hypothetical protein
MRRGGAGDVVTGFVIPIKECSLQELAAVRFAVEFGQRNGGHFFFLFVDDPMDPRTEPNHPAIRDAIKVMIAQAVVSKGLQADIQYRSGDFIQEVQQFITDHHLAEIIMALPEEGHPRFEAVNKDILLLVQMTHCRILTVKSKPKGV